MKIMVIGSGGREHCLARKIKESEKVKQVFVAPGNAGTAKEFTNIDIKADDIDGLLQFADKNSIDLTVAGPELPLAMGIKDLFSKKGLPLFGPNKFCSKLESSKSFAKEIMCLQNVLTPKYEVFRTEEYSNAIQYIKNSQFPLVIKADGLAAGKGVTICKNCEEAQQDIDENLKNLKHGDSSRKILIEEFIKGDEVSFMCIISGDSIIPLETSEDYKKAYDNDQGDNTGGMGAYSPSIFIDNDMKTRIINDIFKPIVKGLAITGESYSGILYAGLIIKDNKIYVLEFNVRFGDPETQTILIKLESDIIDLFESTIYNKLNQHEISWADKSSISITLASEGYPGKYKKGMRIYGLEDITDPNINVFHCGTSWSNNELYTSGGRVLTVSALGQSIKECRDIGYNAIKKISFDGMFYRTDIGLKAI